MIVVIFALVLIISGISKVASFCLDKRRRRGRYEEVQSSEGDALLEVTTTAPKEEFQTKVGPHPKVQI